MIATRTGAGGGAAGRSSVADRLARSAWRSLLLAIGVGLVAGAPTALLDAPDSFEWPIRLQSLTFALALGLGFACLLIGLWDLVRGRWRASARLLLVFGGILVVIVGTEVGAHMLVPCQVTRALGWGTPDWDPSPCGVLAPTPLGREVFGRLHQLHHTLLAGVPLAAGLRLALRKWYPVAL